MGWRGKIDVLSLSGTSCEIVEFKTGAPQNDHASQVRTYSVLWSRDVELNPAARPADKLTLSYRTGEVSVDPLGPLDLESLERELTERSDAARAAASAALPEARPSAENCRYCSVRQLCEEYWRSDIQSMLGAAKTEHPAFMDIELSVTGRHGAASWDGTVVVSRLTTPGRRFLLRTAQADLSLRPNDHVRVIDAHVTIPDDATEPGIATLGARSEMFVVDKR
jgi:hypothetical protein